MSCRKHGHDDDNCVCAVLRAIADVQDQVDPDPDNGDCLVSCERSIDQLLNPVVSPNTNGNNTIPVILYCECAPFKGFGVRRNGTFLECVSSFYFRVTSVDDDCCAVLELLKPITGVTAASNGYPPIAVIDDPCEQLGEDTTTFERTGICITMDLSCFCGVTCLEPIRATRAV